MIITPPLKIELDSNESNLYSQILTYDDSSKEWQPIADQMEKLFKSLIERNAIPKDRLKIFQDASFAEAGKKSILQNFEKNGTSGSEIFRHPHFLKYLKYFIEGPDLPQNVISGLCKIASEESFINVIECTETILKYIRACTREYKLDRRKTSTEFFRLAIEIGFSLNDSKKIRKMVMARN